MYMTEYTNKINCVFISVHIYMYMPHIKHTFIEKFLDIRT